MTVNWLNILFCLTLILAVTTSEADAKVYKWVDENGTIHFSDKPYSDKAKEVNVKSTGIKVTGDKVLSDQKDVTDARQNDNRKPKKPKEPDKPNEITEADYRITSNVGQMGADTIRISGRLNSGPRCKNLSIEATAVTDTGLEATIKTSTRKVILHGSVTFEGYAKVSGSSEDSGFWKVSTVTVRCND